jgi:hypothetical protein
VEEEGSFGSRLAQDDYPHRIVNFYLTKSQNMVGLMGRELRLRRDSLFCFLALLAVFPVLKMQGLVCFLS